MLKDRFHLNEKKKEIGCFTFGLGGSAQHQGEAAEVKDLYTILSPLSDYSGSQPSWSTAVF